MTLRGAPYPIEKHPLGLLHSIENIDAVKADVLILLLTNPGERVMMLNYGTPLRKMIFEPNDIYAVEQAKNIIANSIRTWEPRIALEDVQVTSSVNNSKLDSQDDFTNKDHILGVTINFRNPLDLDSLEAIRLEVPTGGENA